MAGLQRLCKLYGSMELGGVLWLWDYARNEPVKADEMPKNSLRWKASEKAREGETIGGIKA